MINNRKFGSDIENLVKQKSSNHIVLKSRSFSFDGKSKAPSHITKKTSFPVQNDLNASQLHITHTSSHNGNELQNKSVKPNIAHSYLSTNSIYTSGNISVREIVRNRNGGHINKLLMRDQNNVGDYVNKQNINNLDAKKNQVKKQQEDVEKRNEKQSIQMTNLANNIKQNEQLVPIYLTDCIKYMRHRQVLHTKESNSQCCTQNMNVCMPDLNRIKQLNPGYLKRRAHIIDWMVNVHFQLKLFPQTLFIAVKYLDIYFSKNTIKKWCQYDQYKRKQQDIKIDQKQTENESQQSQEYKQIQMMLIAVSCIHIAGKFQQTYQIPYVKNIQEVLKICMDSTKKRLTVNNNDVNNGTKQTINFQNFYQKLQFQGKLGFSRLQLIEIQSKILSALQFQLIIDTPVKYLELLRKLKDVQNKNSYIAQYIIQLSLLQSSCMNYSSSLLSSATLYLVNKIRKITPSWPQQFKLIMGYEESELKNCAKALCANLEKNQLMGFARNIRSKYSRPQFCGASHIKLQRKNQ